MSGSDTGSAPMRIGETREISVSIKPGSHPSRSELDVLVGSAIGRWLAPGRVVDVELRHDSGCPLLAGGSVCGCAEVDAIVRRLS